jgi:ubiquinone biosynthesis accessory factor UbiJ
VNGSADRAGGDRSPGPLDGLAAVLADVLGDLASAALDLDPLAAARLRALDGTRIRFHARVPAPAPREGAGGTPLELTAWITEGRLRIVMDDHRQADAIVSGTLSDLTAWALTRGRARAADIRIDGDEQRVHELERILREFAPDLERPAAHLMGATAAAHVVGFAELALAAFASAAQVAGSGLRDGIGAWFTDRRAVAAFLDDLDALHLRVDRLDARVEMLERGRLAARRTGAPQ